MAKVEWHAGELFPRVGFIVTNLNKHSKNVVKFHNGRGTAEPWIKEGKYVTFQLAEVAAPRRLFAAILDRIALLAIPPPSEYGCMNLFFDMTLRYILE